jgi:peroxiredoxin-like protein
VFFHRRTRRLAPVAHNVHRGRMAPQRRVSVDGRHDLTRRRVAVRAGKEEPMQPFPHRYQTRLAGGPTGRGIVSSTGLPMLETAAPVDFDGPGDAWSPEHLFLAAIQACFLLTFRAVARASQLEWVTLDVDATGVVDREARTTRFTEVVLTPRLTVPVGTDREHAMRVLTKAEHACLISASISTPIRLEASVVESSAPARRIA